MKRIIPLGIVLSAMGLSMASASAGTIDAGGVITAKPDGNDFDYTITLTNTGGAGSDSIATFWFGWVPGADFLPTNPLGVSLPFGWKDVITHGGTGDGYAIQFDALSTVYDVAPGSSLTLAFQSGDTPQQLAGVSPFYSNFPALTSFVYSTGPFRGDGEKILVSFASVPEPSTLTLGAAGVVSLALLQLRRKVKA